MYARFDIFLNKSNICPSDSLYFQLKPMNVQSICNSFGFRRSLKVTEKHQKPTSLTKMSDVLTSQYRQNLILTIILRRSKRQQIPIAYSSETQVEGTANIAYSVFQCHLFWKKANISLSVTLNALRFTNASYIKVKAKDNTPHRSFHPRLIYWNKTSVSVDRAPMLKGNCADRKRRSPSPWY